MGVVGRKMLFQVMRLAENHGGTSVVKAEMGSEKLRSGDEQPREIKKRGRGQQESSGSKKPREESFKEGEILSSVKCYR